MPLMAHLDLALSRDDERGETRHILRLHTSGELASGETANVTIHNASVSGLLIETGLPLAQGEELMIELPQIGLIAARAVWHSGQLFGCRFETEVNSAALSALQLQSEPALPEDIGPFVAPLSTQPIRPNVQFPPKGPHGRGNGAIFGKKIEQLRKARGLTLADVARELGVSKPTVWAWEKGKARPIDDRIPALANLLQIDPSQLAAEPGPNDLARVVDDARIKIASTCGIMPEKIRIMVDL